MIEEVELIYSPLQRKITENGHTVDVHIYRSVDSLWILEVVNSGGTSICWDDQFPTDQEALDEVLRAIGEEGIEALAIDGPSIH